MFGDQEKYFSFDAGDSSEDFPLEELIALLADDSIQQPGEEEYKLLLNNNNHNSSQELVQPLTNGYSELNSLSAHSGSTLNMTHDISSQDNHELKITFIQINNDNYYRNMKKVLKHRHDRSKCFPPACLFCLIEVHKKKYPNSNDESNQNSDSSVNFSQLDDSTFIPCNYDHEALSKYKRKRNAITIARSERAKKMKRVAGMFSKDNEKEYQSSSS